MPTVSVREYFEMKVAVWSVDGDEPSTMSVNAIYG